MEILLNKKRSKRATNINNNIGINFRGNKKLLPQSNLFTTINELDVYNNERQLCNLIRLNCAVNTICSNVLFNMVTEVVKNEGSPNSVKVLNYGLTDGYLELSDFDNKIYCKTTETFTHFGSKEAIRDTQISSERCGFKYLCGIDIFNNHLLRNTTFKIVCYDGMKTSYFNTINDYMRDEEGLFIKGEKDNGTILDKQHLYLVEEVLSFDDSIGNNLYERNGWFGFTNVGKFSTIDNNNEVMDIFRVINYRRSCDFIQMYPSSDLFSFVPKYNNYIHRIEKNWNYCLTYPSSSTTHNITFIREKTNSLRIMYVDDRIKLPNGVRGIKIYSICKHGLKKGDKINFYQNDDIILHSCEVYSIDDEYVFNVISNGVTISTLWYELTKEDVETSGTDDFWIQKEMTYEEKNGQKTVKLNGVTYNINIGTLNVPNYNANASDDENSDLTDETHVYPENYFNTAEKTVKMLLRYIITEDREKVYQGFGDDRKTYYLLNHKYVNLDDNAQDLSYKRVIDGEEMKYYVRVFSRIPNWKGCDTEVTPETIYDNEKQLLARYQTLEHDFENHISQLAFAKNIYGDDIAEIVYTDDIDISYLKDNLGRPVSSIFLTILKNNKGYKEWYGKNGGKEGQGIELRNRSKIDDENYHIEYSHCFGMLNCAFKLSKESLPSLQHNNSLQINNIDSSFQYQGLDVEDLQHSNLVYEKINGVNIIDNDTDDEETKNRSFRSKFKDVLNDEIQYGEYDDDDVTQYGTYKGDTHFYGDFCCYSNNLALEEVIQPIDMRFNTAQREVGPMDTSYQYFYKLYYDEIVNDDLDKDGFKSQEHEIVNCNQNKEGYIYNPHYEIPIKTISNVLYSREPIIMTIVKIEPLLLDETNHSDVGFLFKTLTNHNLREKDVVYLKYTQMDGVDNQGIQQTKVVYFSCVVEKIIDNKIFVCTIINEQGERQLSIDTTSIYYYSLFKRDEDIPTYATFIKDGSCRFVWRDVISNGFDDKSDNEVYPFLNGALYVNKQINVFVKRQNPDLSTSQLSIENVIPKTIKNNDKDNYYREKDISC